MLNKLNIPKKIKVGYQNRQDTYTGKLAYVIYFDAKGVLRKEKSWEGWRDKKIDPQELNNEPTSGFVLNKGVGGARHSYGWNARNEYIRVYDPRNFEFEISVSNLLFILQECSAIKGKGLEGEFVYAWDGTELVLLPVDCPEYKESTKHCDLQLKKVGAKDVVVGCTYLNKDQEEIMYMGRLVWFDKTHHPWRDGNKIFGKKQHVFVYLKPSDKNERRKYWLQSGFTKLAGRTSDKPIPQYAEEYEKLMKSRFVSKPVSFTVKELKIDFDRYWYGSSICVPVNGKYYLGSLNENDESRRSYGYGVTVSQEDRKYDIVCFNEAVIENDEYKEISQKITRPDYYGFLPEAGVMLFEKRKISFDEVKMLGKDLYVVCENGAEYKKGD